MLENPINPLGMTKEEYVQAALPYKKMEEGLGNRPKAELQEIPEIPEKDLLFWCFEEASSMLFKSYEDALAFSLKNVFISRWGEDPSPISDKIVTTKFYSKKVLAESKEAIENAKRIEESNRSITSKVSTYDYNLSNIIRSLEKEWEDTEANRLLKEEIQTIYQEFLDLTAQDSDKAMTYLFKAFKNLDEEFIKDIVNESNFVAS